VADRGERLIDVRSEERYWYPDDGGEIWIAGYYVLDGDRFVGRDDPWLAEQGLRVAGVAGAEAHHADVLASDAVAPGEPLELRRDRGNAHDPNAIMVLAGGAQAGWVPREVATELAPLIDAGESWSAVVLRERRATPRDPRAGLTMLLARGGPILLRER
jgi:HIRAN domain